MGMLLSRLIGLKRVVRKRMNPAWSRLIQENT
jgi:hypothetical protein